MKRTGEPGVEETILEGHIGVTKELLAFQTPEKKFYIGCEKGGASLIKVNLLDVLRNIFKNIFCDPFCFNLINVLSFHKLFIGVNG